MSLSQYIYSYGVSCLGKGSAYVPLTILNSQELSQNKRLRNDGKEAIYLQLSKDSEKKGKIHKDLPLFKRNIVC